ncbi:MAG: transcriptional regulator [Mycobacterium sp.]|nr:transcriptional regulator [Mycobacterium sp.]
MSQTNFGPQLRAIRMARKLSLRSVAAAVGVSPSLLSQVETGKTNPSVSTLYALVNHLDVPIEDLMGTNTPSAAPAAARGHLAVVAGGSSAIQRREDAPTIEMENGVTWERLAVGPFGMADPLITTYAPGGSSSVEGRMMRHSGVEYGYIIEGELTLKLDFDTFSLGQGDSVCFDSMRPHLYINHTDATTRGLWFVVGHERPQTATDGAEQASDHSVKSAVDILAVMRNMH